MKIPSSFNKIFTAIFIFAVYDSANFLCTKDRLHTCFVRLATYLYQLKRIFFLISAFLSFICIGYVEKWTLHRIIHSFSQSFLSNITLRAPRMIKCHSWSFEVEENTVWPLLSAYQWAGEFFAWKICFFSHHLARGLDQN